MTYRARCARRRELDAARHFYVCDRVLARVMDRIFRANERKIAAYLEALNVEASARFALVGRTVLVDGHGPVTIEAVHSASLEDGVLRAVVSGVARTIPTMFVTVDLADPTAEAKGAPA